mmetsp:Transcript_32986/g.55606  ORF Transcript_32986/g.55606 Transcript_32986/m.55606 type:complete len:721 (+) Transcript_32986:69-2231(+)
MQIDSLPSRLSIEDSLLFLLSPSDILQTSFFGRRSEKLNFTKAPVNVQGRRTTGICCSKKENPSTERTREFLKRRSKTTSWSPFHSPSPPSFNLSILERVGRFLGLQWLSGNSVVDEPRSLSPPRPQQYSRGRPGTPGGSSTRRRTKTRPVRLKLNPLDPAFEYERALETWQTEQLPVVLQLVGLGWSVPTSPRLRGLLTLAFVHSSFSGYTYEGRSRIKSYLQTEWWSYERLEFLGDLIMKKAIGEHLYHNVDLLSEGKMTQQQHVLESNMYCARVMRVRGLDRFILKHPDQPTSDAIVADVCEALIAAAAEVYGESESVRLVRKFFLGDSTYRPSAPPSPETSAVPPMRPSALPTRWAQLVARALSPSPIFPSKRSSSSSSGSSSMTTPHSFGWHVQQAANTSPYASDTDTSKASPTGAFTAYFNPLEAGQQMIEKSAVEEDYNDEEDPDVADEEIDEEEEDEDVELGGGGGGVGEKSIDEGPVRMLAEEYEALSSADTPPLIDVRSKRHEGSSYQQNETLKLLVERYLRDTSSEQSSSAPKSAHLSRHMYPELSRSRRRPQQLDGEHHIQQDSSEERDSDRSTEVSSECPHCAAADIRSLEQARVFRRKGNASFRYGKWRWAAYWFSLAIELDPLCAVHYSNRSLARLRAGIVDDAESDALCSVQLDPGWPTGHVRLGEAYLVQGRFEEAAQSFLQGIRLVNQSKRCSLCMRPYTRC